MKNRKRREFCQNRGGGLPNPTSMFFTVFLQVRLLQNEKSDKKTGKLGEISHIGGRGGGVDGVSPYGKNSHIFPFFILISFVKSFKVFQFVASGLF